MQLKSKKKIPEIRVWCHPEKVGENGEDYFKVFNSFKEALDFIKCEKRAEQVPLLAYNGMEINILEIEVPEEILSWIKKSKSTK